MGGESASRHVAPPRWVPELRWRRVFPGEEHQLRILRRWLASLLPERPARDDVTCVASELGANAIRHTASGRGGWFAAEITWYSTMVRVAVADAGAPRGPRLVDDPGSENGRGLIVVRGLSVRSGVCGDHRGRLVWADIPWTEPGSLPAQDPYEAAIHEGEASLARQFDSIPAWFGRSTLQWWALASPRGLVSAPTAHELAIRLDALASSPSPAPAHGAPGTDGWDPAWQKARRDVRPATHAQPLRQRGYPARRSQSASEAARDSRASRRGVGWMPRRSQVAGPVAAACAQPR